MPEDRGAELLDAALTVIAEQGLGALSVRSVAAAAGVSPALVQYYFHSKNELVKAGFEYAGDLFMADLRELESDDLDDLIRMWLPLDERRERRAKVWLAYASTASVEPEIAAESARLDVDLRAEFAEAFAGRGVPEPDTAAAQLLALIDGVTLQSLVLPMADREHLAARTITPFLRRVGG